MVRNEMIRQFTIVRSRMVLVKPLNEAFFVFSVLHEGADLQCHFLREFFYLHAITACISFSYSLPLVRKAYRAASATISDLHVVKPRR